jgi:tyrosyl-tRNA synthetase
MAMGMSGYGQVFVYKVTAWQGMHFSSTWVHMSFFDTIRRNTDTVIGLDGLEARLASKRPLRVKLGVDPTRPDLTFGHMVVLNKLRQFQDLGHEAILIIGDFTTLIGDPSGRSATRPVLTAEEIRENAATYLDQAFLVLDEERTTVRYNSEWFGKMGFEDCLKLARKMTVARMLERDDFSKRYQDQAPISLVEFLYPLIQGYDSLVLKADVEIGGTDQLFNMLVGRTLQKDAGQPEQAVITMPLLVGLDGVKKMSKSMDNFIAFTDSPKEMFGKIMSIDDTTMLDYYRLLLEADEAMLERIKGEHPMSAKKHLAASLVGLFYTMEIAREALQQFEQVFTKQEEPDDMPVFTWHDLVGDLEQAAVVDLLSQTELFESKGAIRRLIQQGGVKCNREKINDPQMSMQRSNEEWVFQAGKRIFLKILG